MVRITNGTTTFEVTAGAYNTLFKAQGYMIVTEQGVQEDALPPVADPAADEGTLTPPAQETDGEDNSEASQEDEEPDAGGGTTEDEGFDIPVSEMNPTMLRAYAETLGVTIEGMKTKEIRQAVEELLARG